MLAHTGPVYFFVVSTVLGYSALARGQSGPSEPDFALQWGLHNIGQIVADEAGTIDADVDAPEAWTLFEGAPNVVVAILGRGIDPHPEFADRLLEGRATVGDLYNTLDTCPHDTHLAGIIAAAADNGLGIAGLHDGVKLLPVRVLDGCGGSESSTAEGMRWAVDQGADVILAAVQFLDGTEALADAVAYAVAHDVLVVAPTGSDGNNEVAFPGAFDGCLAVTATTNRDTLSSLSNFGPQVDLSAPGEHIWSTWVAEGFAFQLSGRDTASASAFVAGVAALVRSYAPQLTAEQVMQVLRDSSDDLGEAGWDQFFGYGRVNARRALEISPPPALRFEYVDPPPAVIPPQAAPSFVVRIVEVGEELVEGSAVLVHRVDASDFSTKPLVALGGDRYLVELPAVRCDATLEYYLLAEGSGATLVTDPLEAPDRFHVALARQATTLFEDDFESDLGWEVVVLGGATTTGGWTRVEPGQQPGQPAYDRSPDAGRSCFVTGQLKTLPDVSVDVDGGPVRLVSPVIAVDGDDVEVSYARWFSSSGEGDEDVLIADFSLDGGTTWTVVETVSSTDGWVTRTFRVSDFPDVEGDQLRVRFSTSDEPNDSLTEAAIDEVQVRSILCASRPGDANRDGIVDRADFAIMWSCLTGPATSFVDETCDALDFDSNDRIDIADFQAFQGVFAER